MHLPRSPFFLLNCRLKSHFHPLPISHKQSFSTSGHTSSLTFRTCTKLYPKLHSLNPKLYKHTPKEGFDITINYADSSLNSTHTTKPSKTIVAIHGVYGYATHYDRLFSHFSANPDIRVIAPNMPDFAHTRRHGFWHTPIEKATFLLDFLRTLEVNQVDCITGHSSATPTIFALVGEPSQTSVTFSSVALVAPQTLWVEFHPRFAKMQYILLLRNDAWYKALALARVHTWKHWVMEYSTLDEFLTTCTLFLDPNLRTELRTRVEYFVRETSIPISLLGGAKDKLVYPRSNAEFHRVLGIDPKEIVVFDPKMVAPEEVMSRGRDGRRMHSYSLLNSGHFAHIKHPDFTGRLVENLLNRQ